MIMDMIADSSQNQRETMRQLTGHRAAVQAMELMSSFFKHIKANDEQMSERIRTQAVRVLMGIFLWDPERDDPTPYLAEVVDAGAEQGPKTEHSTSQRGSMRELTGPKAAARAMELMNSFFKDIEANDKRMSERIRTEAVRVLMGIFLWDPKTGDTTPQLVLVVDAGAEGEQRGTERCKSLDKVKAEAVVETVAAAHPKNRKSQNAGTENSRTLDDNHTVNPVEISGGKEKRERSRRETCGKGRKINYNMVQNHKPGMLKEEVQGARAEAINQFLKALLEQEKEKQGNETRIPKESTDGTEAKAEKDKAEETEAENSITLAIINMHDNSARNTSKGTETRRGTQGEGRKINYKTFQDKTKGEKEKEDGVRGEAINFVLKVLQEAQKITMSLDGPISNIHDEPDKTPGNGTEKKKRTRRGTRGKGRKIHYKKSQDQKRAVLKEEDDGARAEAINLVLKVLQEAQKITMSLGGAIANMHDKPVKNPGMEHQRKKWTRRGTRGKGRKIHYEKFQDKKRVISNIHDKPVKNTSNGTEKKKRTRRGTRGKGRKINYTKFQDKKREMQKEEKDLARAEAINLILKVLLE
ncbi:uncharacterized protein Hap1MRO34_011623 isoform 2-T2 [Clarias gariepinus]|uniref:uncharacterized protein LOC128530611 isoform X2 n=1 Tax=Clarias gariepinus TaxID=13013 RepID=UPI00234DD3C1|nr:uncharacterized protein LOC128530611 isoform X2 [Clarias gariepinus]